VGSLQPGDPQHLGPYRLLEVLGAGGFGRVFLGRSADGRLAAVKMILSDHSANPEYLTRFRREAAAARKVGGRFTAQVIDADLDGPVPWLATAYISGPSLAGAVKEFGPLPARSVLTLAAGLADALTAIHAAGLVHRDLKPENVLLARDGPRVIDFGIARATGASTLTSTGVVVGTVAFMSPEQVRGGEVGPPSDVFSLGSVLVFAATGRGPFGYRTTIPVGEVLARVAFQAPSLDQVPPELRALVERCLTKDPARRPSPGDLLAYLGGAHPAADWLPGPVTSTITEHASQPRHSPTSTGESDPDSLRTVISRASSPQLAPPASPHPPRYSPPGHRQGQTPRPQARPRSRPAPRRKRVLATVAGTAVTLAIISAVLLNSGSSYTTLSGADGQPPVTTAFSPNGQVLAGGYSSGLTVLIGNTYLWNVASGRQIAELPRLYGATDSVQALAFSPDGKSLAVGYSKFSGASGGITCIWNITSRKCTLKLRDPASGEVQAMAFSPNGRLLAVADSSGVTYIWNTVNGRLVRTLTGSTAIAFSHDGTMMANGDGTGTVYLWDLTTGRIEATVVLPSNSPVTSIAISPNGKYAAASCFDGSTYLWRLPDNNNSWTVVDHPGNEPIGAVSVIFSPDGKLLLTAESSGTVYVRTVPSLHNIGSLSIPSSGSITEITSVALSPDSDTLAISPNEGPIYLWPAKASHM
jgi:serine/threonine protein kinase